MALRSLVVACKPPFLVLPRLGALVPGLGLCGLVSVLALVGEGAERSLFGSAWLEALVLAILIGAVVRTIWQPGGRYQAGIACAAKTFLEAAVALMGATMSFEALAQAGLPLVAGIVLIVVGAITASFALGRLFGLPRKMALLVACGNAICGNSAIAAVAPVINAKAKDVAAAIAFTAVLGVAVVLLMPVLAGVLGLSAVAGGALAGLTVYAVPQVIAAAGPLGVVAVQFGTLVKLIRVLMLGPVVAVFSLMMARQGQGCEVTATKPTLGVFRFLPWFILAFLALAAARSLGWVPDLVVEPAHQMAGWLTVISMAGLGLGVDLRAVTAAGPRITAVVVVSLLILTGASLVLLDVIGMV
jgi:uncharacterized integral membrane protein (TIGR00698 family)